MSITFKGPVPVPKAQSSPLHVLITGASRGIGLELVKQYSTAHQGNIVLAAVRNPPQASELKAFAGQHSNVHIIALDVDSEESIRASVKQVEKVVDRLDVLINNAAIAGGADALNPATVSAQTLNSVFNTNVTGVLIVTQTYLPLLQRSGTDAKVVNVSTGLGSNALAFVMGQTFAAYGVSKAALNYLTTVFRHAVPSVTFLAINPGWVATDMGNGGGHQAPTKVEDSVQAIRYYIAEKTIKNSGEYLDTMTGEAIPF